LVIYSPNLKQTDPDPHILQKTNFATAQTWANRHAELAPVTCARPTSQEAMHVL